MKKISTVLVSLLTMFSFAVAPLSTSYASPSDVFTDACKNSNDPTLCSGSTGDGLFSVIRTVIQVMLIIGGIIAVIMIIIGGIRYMTSNGDQADVKAAKDTILYSIVGLVVAMGGYAIVTWVVGQL